MFPILAVHGKKVAVLRLFFFSYGWGIWAERIRALLF